MSSIVALAGGDAAGLRALSEAVPDPGGLTRTVVLEGCAMGAAGRAQIADAPDGSGVALVADTSLDAGAILDAYLRLDDRCREALAGEYAFVVWDPRRRALVCARDHVGTRPLFWWSDGGNVAVASDPDVLLAHPRAERRPDDEAYLASVTGVDDGLEPERSYWRGVNRVPPRQVVVVARNGSVAARHEHWTPAARPLLRLPGARDYAEALRDGIAAATRAAVEAPAALGAHVSGGLDSSAIAVVAQRELRRGGRGLERAFSWAPDPSELAPQEEDERLQVSAVAAMLGVPVSFVGGDQEVRRLHRERRDARRPVGTSLRETSVMRIAQREGMEVVLTGWGGDEVASFNGRGVLPGLLRRGRVATLSHELVAIARKREEPLARAIPRMIRRGVVGPLASPLVRRVRGPHELRRKLRIPEPVEQWGDGARVVEELAREAQERMRRAIARGGRATQVELLRRGHITRRLEAWALLGNEHGVEHRYPLLDRRLLDLCLSFPEELWLRDGWSRWLFRAAADPLLPAGMAWANLKHEPAIQATGRAARTVAHDRSRR